MVRQQFSAHVLAPVLCILFLHACKPPSEKVTQPFGAEDLRAANRELLEVAMVDAFNPPIASRVYVYPHIAHYLTLRVFHPDSLVDLVPLLNGLDSLPNIDHSDAHDELSALLAFCHTARIVVFSEHRMEELAEHFRSKAREAGMPTSTLDASERVAKNMTTALKAWLLRDNYVETRTMERHTAKGGPGSWSETPPDYTPALEPNWDKIRPLLVKDASFYVVHPMLPYSTQPGTPFHSMVREMYDASLALNDSTRHIALYWDDNPNISTHRGHLVTQEHRISPPGHWLNIVSQVTRQQGSNTFRTTEAYTLSAIAMFDGLISCWHEKFRTDVVRPITYINELIDPDWTSLIQTPPFPEYPSGHSVVSAAAATVLDHLYGNDLAFTDSTEAIFGLGVRDFRSFQEAAWEVSLSRFYGGIHYMPSIQEGNTQGKAIGARLINSLEP